MSDFTEVTFKSPFQRIGDSIKGVLVGLVLIIASPVGLWINEKMAVDAQAGLGEGARAVVHVEPTAKDAGGPAKLVHLTGKATTAANLADPDFGVSAVAIHLKRHVEMYQWVEEKHEKKSDTVGGSEKTVVTYDHKKKWDDDYHDSQNFKDPEREKYKNPAMTLKSMEWDADDVKVGEFKLSKTLIHKINNSVALPITPEMVAKFPPELGDKYKAANGGLQSGNAASPVVGDLKVNFQVVNQQDVSICASSNNNALGEWKASNGYEVELLQCGTFDSKQMFDKAMSDAAMMTWIFRFLGFICMWIGISMVFAPIGTVARSIPLFGMLMGGAVDAGVGLFAFMVAMFGSLLVISIAWLAARPMLSVGLMVGVLALIAAVASMRKGGGAPKAA